MSSVSNDLMPYTRESRALLPDELRLGPVRLAVTDLNRSVDFYIRVVGLQLARRGREGDYEVAHLGTGAGEEDVVVLQEEPGVRAADKHLPHAGLYHVALNYPSRLELARTVRRIAESRAPVQGGSNHQTHEAIYLADPDGNGLELAWDAPREKWPPTLTEYLRDGREPLDYDGLLAMTAAEPHTPPAAPGLRVGHVHLHVGSIGEARAFYVDLLGFELQMDLGTGAFASAGRYHHHLGFNTWRGEGATPRPNDFVGLREWRIYLPSVRDLEAARARLEAGGAQVTLAGPHSFSTTDPWSIPLYVGVDPTAR